MAQTGNPDTTLTTRFLSVRGQEFSGHAARSAAPAATDSEFTETGNDHELRSQAISANLADDKEASIVLSASQQTKRDSQTTGSKAKQREERQWLQLTLADQARRLSEQLGRQIEQLETAFEAEMGDAWREQIANKVMDADDIPERREGESMHAYRERLETVLIATMIDPATGEIRPEYTGSDDPDVQRYAEWAQAQHQKRDVDAYLEKRDNPTLSEAELTELDNLYSSSATFSALRQSEARNQTSDTRAADFSTSIDERREALAVNSSGEASTFGISL